MPYYHPDMEGVGEDLCGMAGIITGIVWGGIG